MVFRTKWYERDFFYLKEKNILFEIAVLYGAYIFYSAENDSNFLRFYEKNKIKMREIFINRTNQFMKFKLKLDGIYSSGRKMRRLYSTNSRSRVESYPWFASFFTCLLREITNQKVLLNIVCEMLSNCKFCGREKEDKYILICCAKKILGFQFYFLNRISSVYDSSKKKEEACRCLNSITSSDELKILKEECSLCN